MTGKKAMEMMRMKTKKPIRIWQTLFVAAALVMASCAVVQAQSAPANGVEANSLALGRPHGVAYDTAGNAYIADTDENVIRKVNTSGIITTVAGDGEQGYGGDGGQATEAQLDSPAGVAVDTSGNIYIADTHNNVVREVLASSGNIATIAGTGVASFSGDGAAATAATLSYPTAVAVDTSGNVYIADTNNHRIREISGGNITTVAGDGEQFYAGDGVLATTTGLDSPTGIAVDAAFNLYIGDTLNQRVRKVTYSTGLISTLIGTGEKGFTGDGYGPSAALARPRGLAVDSSGDLYLADSDNQRVRVLIGGNLTTVAGSGTEGFSGDGSAATRAWLDSPDAVAVSGAKVLISDTENDRVRLLSNGTIDTLAGQAISPAPSALISPTPSSTLSGPSATFIWSAGSYVTNYMLHLGTTGPGAYDIYDSASTTATSASITNLPGNGEKIYARLYSKLLGVWSYIDYTYAEAGTPVASTLISPSLGSTLNSSSVTFSWSTGTGVTNYMLYVGSTGAGSHDLYDIGLTTATSATVSGLPTYGQTIYVRLYSKISGSWTSYNDYTFVDGSPVASTITSPTADSTLTGPSQTFTWANTGASNYMLYLGTTGPGSHDVYDIGSVTTTSATVTNLPTDGVTIYARLYSKISGSWSYYNDYTFTASGTPTPSELTAPTATTLAGSEVTFTWSAGSGVTNYMLYIGSTGPGSHNLYDVGSVTSTSADVTGLPSDGSKVYVRLYSKINGNWTNYTDYVFTAQ
jgi:hypothetical protein